MPGHGPADPGPGGGALPSIRLVLVRHAQAAPGRSDPGLSPLGRRQAAAVAAALRDERFDRLVVSPLRRARETAAALSAHPAPVVDDRLREFDFGPGAPPAEQMVEERDDLRLWRDGDGFPGGETLGAFETRVRAALEDLVAGGESSVCVVTHSGVVLATMRWAWHLPPSTPWETEVEGGNGAITEIVHWPRGQHAAGAPRMTVLHRVGDRAHLAPALRSDV